ncbi:Lrp/AsnC family transcriptional regulator [Tritonibacter aquimaris]|nr:Lrp/AsnC family transcriptional regulator [Tritonibacter aquimaris]
MDQFDLRILAALQGDGTLTNAALSEQVHLSASQCSRRRVALEQAGLIEGYRAKLSAEKLGVRLQAIVRVTLKEHDKDAHNAFSSWVSAQPEVQSAFSASGDADYILMVRMRDLEAFSEFLHERLLFQPQVAQVKSDFVLKTLKDSQELDVYSVSAS